jgi:hypothetical protein
MGGGDLIGVELRERCRAQGGDQVQPDDLPIALEGLAARLRRRVEG